MRAQVPYYSEDRFFAPDIEQASEYYSSGCLNELIISKTTAASLSEV
ncbi:hypothetical protein ACLFLN_04055 [Acinetobacter pittii]